MMLGTLILVLVVVGVIMFFVTTYIPMEPKIKQLLVIAVVVFLVIWLLQAFGIFGLNEIRIGR
jgi:hypothetical protein